MADASYMPLSSAVAENSSRYSNGEEKELCTWKVFGIGQRHPKQEKLSAVLIIHSVSLAAGRLEFCPILETVTAKEKAQKNHAPILQSAN